MASYLLLLLPMLMSTLSPPPTMASPPKRSVYYGKDNYTVPKNKPRASTSLASSFRSPLLRFILVVLSSNCITDIVLVTMIHNHQFQSCHCFLQLSIAQMAQCAFRLTSKRGWGCQGEPSQYLCKD